MAQKEKPRLEEDEDDIPIDVRIEQKVPRYMLRDSKVQKRRDRDSGWYD